MRINWVLRFQSPGFLVLGNFGDPESPAVVGVPKVLRVPGEIEGVDMVWLRE